MEPLEAVSMVDVLRDGGPAEQPGLPAPSLAEALAGFSAAFDLAEGREAGHAVRLTHIALTLCEAAALGDDVREAVFYGGLLHDSGVPLAGERLGDSVPLEDERELFASLPALTPHEVVLPYPAHLHSAILDAFDFHTRAGAAVARRLGLPAAVQEAIACHHEAWDGSGLPGSVQGGQLPLAAQVLAISDKLESVIATTTPALLVRQHVPVLAIEQAGVLVEAELAASMFKVLKRDGFWLSLYAEPLSVSSLPWLPASALRPADLRGIAAVMASLADRRNHHLDGYSEDVAATARRLGAHCGLPGQALDRLYLAALLHDIGTLGVPARLIGKPDLFGLEEMRSMKEHPSVAADVLGRIPGFEEIAAWVASHHERVDGAGYPDGLRGDQFAVESQIIGIAEVYHALRAERPYRWALPEREAGRVVRGLAGTQFSADLLERVIPLL